MLAKTVVFIIRRSKPWKSFMREMMQHKVDDCMDFEVFSFWNTIAIAAMNFTIREWLLIIGGGGGGHGKISKRRSRTCCPPQKIWVRKILTLSKTPAHKIMALPSYSLPSSCSVIVIKLDTKIFQYTCVQGIFPRAGKYLHVHLIRSQY